MLLIRIKVLGNEAFENRNSRLRYYLRRNGLIRRLLDSAGGPIKRTKPNEAAVMLLRGKVLNAARTDFEDILNNTELMMIAKGIGATLTDKGFVLTDKNMRFGKIIIAADSDEDRNYCPKILFA